jgi:hypothetical protein
VRSRTYRRTRLVVTDHARAVPLDHDLPEGEQIDVLAREVVASRTAPAMGGRVSSTSRRRECVAVRPDAPAGRPHAFDVRRLVGQNGTCPAVSTPA